MVVNVRHKKLLAKSLRSWPLTKTSIKPILHYYFFLHLFLSLPPFANSMLSLCVYVCVCVCVAKWQRVLSYSADTNAFAFFRRLFVFFHSLNNTPLQYNENHLCCCLTRRGERAGAFYFNVMKVHIAGVNLSQLNFVIKKASERPTDREWKGER